MQFWMRVIDSFCLIHCKPVNSGDDNEFSFDRLTKDDAHILKNATTGCAHLERLHQHVR